MVKSQCRCVAQVDDYIKVKPFRRSIRRPGTPATRPLEFRLRRWWMLTILIPAIVFTTQAQAQDAPAKTEAPPESKPAEASAEDLSVRYRFLEKYALIADPEKPELITQYQVGVRASHQTIIDKPQGAPERFDSSMQMIYTEAPAKVGKLGEVLDAVRRFDNFSLKSAASAQAPKLPLFKGLTILYHLRPGQDAEILSLTSERSLREIEFAVISKQVFLPRLMALFPPTPVRVGDTWHIPLASAQYLVGEAPEPEDYQLDGNLIQVRQGAMGTALTAIVGVSGQFTGPDGQNLVNARIHFVFEPRGAAIIPVASGSDSSPRTAGGPAKPAERIADARGWISELMMAQTASNPIPDTDDRLKETITYKLHLARRPPPSPTSPIGADDAAPASLTIPEPLPTAAELNSWLLYDDPMGRFHFRHPQELRLEPRMLDANIVGLVDRQLRGSYSMTIQFPAKEVSSERDRQSRDPDYHRRTLYSMWDKQHKDVVGGPTGWLPEQDWNPLKRKVYRIEAALKQSGADAATPRIYSDYYLVLFNTNKAVIVTAMTVQDHFKFRNQAESLIKSIEFGPSTGQPKSSAAADPLPPVPPRP